MPCINVSHPDYKNLLSDSGLHPDILKAQVSLWMNENNTDLFPSLLELGQSKLLPSEKINTTVSDFIKDTIGEEEYLKSSSKPQSLIDNIFNVEDANWDHSIDRDQTSIIDDIILRAIRTNPTFKISAENQEKLDALSKVVGEQEAYRDYFEQNEIVRPANLVLEKLESRVLNQAQLLNLSSGEAMADVSKDDIFKVIGDYIKIENSEKALGLVSKMAKQLNIDAEIISQKDLASRFGITEETGEVKSFYKNGKVYLIDGVFTEDIVFHEFAHPVIKALAKDNPALFAKLYEELIATPEGKEIIKAISVISSDHAPGSTEFMEEAIVRSLQSKYLVPKSWVQNLLFHIKQFLRKSFGKTVNISKLSENTKLSDLFNMLNEGSSFIMDVDFLKMDDVIMYMRSYEEEVAELEQLAVDQTQTIIDDLYSITKKQLSNFTKDNDIYKFLKEELSDDNFNGELQKLLKILDILSVNSKKNNVSLTGIKANINKQTDPTLADIEIENFRDKLSSFVQALVQADLVFDKFESKIDDLSNNGVVTNTEIETLHALDTYVSHWAEYLSGFAPNLYFNSVIGNSALQTRVTNLSNKVNKMTKRLDSLKIEAVIDVLYDKLLEQFEPIKKDFLDQMAALKAAGEMGKYNIVHESYYGLSVDELNTLNRLKSIKNPNVNTELPLLNSLTEKSLKGHNISKDLVRATLENRLGDSSWVNGLMESHLANQDKVVGTFARYLNDVLQEVNANVNSKQSAFREGLKELLSKAGYDNHILGEVALGEAISQTNISSEIKNNEVVEFEEYAFISNFNGHEFKLSQLDIAVTKARKQYAAYGDPNDFLILQQAEFEYEDFLNNYMTRENIPEYYMHDKLFRTPAGKEAILRRDKLFEEMRSFKENLNSNPDDFASNDAMQKVWYDYQQLQNIYDRNGNLKTGIDLEVAKVLTEYSKLTKDFHEYTEVSGEFENALNLYEKHLVNTLKLIPGTLPYEAARKEWLNRNTTVQFDDSYYAQRTALIEKRKKILENLINVNNQISDVSPLYEEIYTILKANKDSLGQADGSMLSKAEQERITNLHEQIIEMQQKLFTLTGLTKEENSELTALNEYYAYYNTFKTEEDKRRYAELTSAYSKKLLGFGITSLDIEMVRQIDNELHSITSTEPTDVYVQTFMSLLKEEQDAVDVLSDFMYKTFEGFTLEDGDEINQSHFYEILNDYDLTTELCNKNPKFKDWFNSNHYDDTGVEKDEKGNIIGEIKVSRKSAAWQFTKPADKKFYKKKNVYSKTTGALIGFLEVDGIPRVPNISYMKRSVKAEYKTKIIERDYVDGSGKLVLANVDNRGQFLPREDAIDSKYINANYRSMFEKNRNLFNLMLHVKNQFLDNQLGLDNSQKRYLTYPALRKSSLESNTTRVGFFSRKFNSFLNVFRNQPDDFEIGLSSNNLETDIYSTLGRPISGNYRLPKTEVSRNIIHSMGTHLYSVEYYKALRKRNSFANLLKSSIEQATIPSAVLKFKNRLKSMKLFTNKADTIKTNRLNQVTSIIDKQFKGITMSIPNSSYVKTAELIRNKLSGMLSFAAFAYSPTSSVTNYAGSKTMLTLKSTDSRLFTPIDLIATQGKSSMIMAKILKNSFSNKQKDLQLQLLDIMDGIPDREKKTAGDIGSRTAIQSFYKGETGYLDRKTLQDSVAAHAFYALLHKHTIEVNGSKQALYDLVELVNGRIQTIAGVPSEYSINYTAEGDVILGSGIKKLMRYHQGVLLKTTGAANSFSEIDALRYVIGKYALALVKFFIPMAADRYGYSTKRKGVVVSTLNTLRGRGEKRINLYLDRAETGSNIGAIEALIDIVNGRFKTLDYNAKIGLLQTLAGLMAKILIGLIVSGFVFNADDEDQLNFSYDPDDEHRFKKLKAATALPNLPMIDSRYTSESGRRFDAFDYWKLQGLRLALRVQREIETFEPTDAFKTIRNIITFKSPLGEGSLTNLVDIFGEAYDMLLGQNKKITKAAGPLSPQQKGNDKMMHLILKFRGFTGKQIDAAFGIEGENSNRF